GSGFAARQPIPACSATAHSGFPSGVWIHDPPRSAAQPPRLAVCSRPPIRSRASSTTHSTPAPSRAFAAASPAIPAPTTTTRISLISITVPARVPPGPRRPGGTGSAGSGQVEPVQLHHLRPRGDEVADELLLRVVAGVDLGQRAQ